MQRAWIIMALWLGPWAAGCAASSVVKTAKHGDLTALKREVEASRKRGDLDERTVVELAEAIAGREVRSAKGREAVQRIRSIRPCASSILPVLRERAGRGDDIGAEASLILLELGKLTPVAAIERHREASAGAWRAVAARAAVAPKYGLLRREWMRDGDQRVRRAALSAAIDSAHPDDREALLEAARVDPDPMSRSLALRALGALGGEREVMALDDLWQRADETTRVSIVDAWAMPAAFRSGGRGRLIRSVETTRGIPALAAAGALVRAGGSDAELGVAALTRGIGEGSVDERSLAIRVAPLDDRDVVAALKKASKEHDLVVQVAALARLVELGSEREQALVRLRELAHKKDDAALAARAALAGADDRSVVPRLDEQLASRRSSERQAAALGLLELREWPGVATGLADDDPSVRTAVACGVLGKRASDG
jgi:hypothetical protein